MNERQKAIAYADKQFSLYVRARDGGRCICCKRVGPTDCAHYITRERLNTRWDERNGNSLCRSCHQDEHNGSDCYTEALQAIHGIKAPVLLRAMGNHVVKLSAAQIKDIGRSYKKKREELI